jgi:hypothetical protein
MDAVPTMENAFATTDESTSSRSQSQTINTHFEHFHRASGQGGRRGGNIRPHGRETGRWRCPCWHARLFVSVREQYVIDLRSERTERQHAPVDPNALRTHAAMKLITLHTRRAMDPFPSPTPILVQLQVIRALVWCGLTRMKLD